MDTKQIKFDSKWFGTLPKRQRQRALYQLYQYIQQNVQYNNNILLIVLTSVYFGEADNIYIYDLIYKFGTIDKVPKLYSKEQHDIYYSMLIEKKQRDLNWHSLNGVLKDIRYVSSYQPISFSLNDVNLSDYPGYWKKKCFVTYLERGGHIPTRLVQYDSIDVIFCRHPITNVKGIIYEFSRFTENSPPLRLWSPTRYVEYKYDEDNYNSLTTYVKPVYEKGIAYIGPYGIKVTHL